MNNMNNMNNMNKIRNKYEIRKDIR